MLVCTCVNLIFMTAVATGILKLVISFWLVPSGDSRTCSTHWFGICFYAGCPSYLNLPIFYLSSGHICEGGCEPNALPPNHQPPQLEYLKCILKITLVSLIPALDTHAVQMMRLICEVGSDSWLQLFVQLSSVVCETEKCSLSLCLLYVLCGFLCNFNLY